VGCVNREGLSISAAAAGCHLYLMLVIAKWAAAAAAAAALGPGTLARPVTRFGIAATSHLSIHTYD